MLVSAYVLSEFKTRADGCAVGFIDLCCLLVGEIREKGSWMSSGSFHWFSYSAFGNTVHLETKEKTLTNKSRISQGQSESSGQKTN